MSTKKNTTKEYFSDPVICHASPNYRLIYKLDGAYCLEREWRYSNGKTLWQSVKTINEWDEKK